MVLHGYVQNGMIIPNGNVSLPDGTQVMITVGAGPQAASQSMSQQERQRYQAALDRIDAAANENAGDAFRGADHDRALYGER